MRSNKLADKLQFVNQVRGSSRGSSGQTQRRAYNPAPFNMVRETNMNKFQKLFDSSPKSLTGNTLYFSKNSDEHKSPLFGQRKYTKMNGKGSKTEIGITNSSLVRSSDSKDSDNGSSSVNYRNNNQQMLFTKPKFGSPNHSKFKITNLSFLPIKNEQAKTSFD